MNGKTDNGQRKRIFIAFRIEPGETFLRIYRSLKTLLSNDRITWVDPGKIHLTLVFLGDTPVERIKTISQVLKEICTGFDECDFLLSGIGVFKNLRDPRVIWIGIEKSGSLNKLNDLICTRLREMGFIIEERPFTPHLTLGRIRALANTDVLKSEVEKYHDVQIQQVHVSEVILYESIPTGKGHIYKPLGQYNMK